MRLTLRKGDKVVRRDARGAIHVVQVTEDRVDVSDVHVVRRGRASAG